MFKEGYKYIKRTNNKIIKIKEKNMIYLNKTYVE